MCTDLQIPHLSASLFNGRRFSDIVQSLSSYIHRHHCRLILVLLKLTVGPIEVKPAAAEQPTGLLGKQLGKQPTVGRRRGKGHCLPGVHCPAADFEEREEIM